MHHALLYSLHSCTVAIRCPISGIKIPRFTESNHSVGSVILLSPWFFCFTSAYATLGQWSNPLGAAGQQLQPLPTTAHGAISSTYTIPFHCSIVAIHPLLIHSSHSRTWSTDTSTPIITNTCGTTSSIRPKSPRRSPPPAPHRESLHSPVDRDFGSHPTAKLKSKVK